MSDINDYRGMIHAIDLDDLTDRELFSPPLEDDIEIAIATKTTMLTCSNCGEEVYQCANCHEYFHEGDQIICKDGKHYCSIDCAREEK